MAYWLGLALISHFKSFNVRSTSLVTIQYYQRSPFDWNSYELNFWESPSIIVTSGIYTSAADSSPAHKWRIEMDPMETLIWNSRYRENQLPNSKFMVSEKIFKFNIDRMKTLNLLLECFEADQITSIQTNWKREE